MLGLVFVILSWPVQAAPFAYIANYGSSSISAIDLASNSVSRTIASGSIVQPYGVAINAAGSQLYLTNTGSTYSSILQVDVGSGTVTETITDANILQPRGIAINPAGTRLYVANYGSNTLSVIDINPASTTRYSVVGTVYGLSQPEGVAVSADGNTVYVTNSGSTTVAAINASTLGLTYLAVGSQPKGIAINPAGTRAYVALYGSNAVAVINLSINSLIDTIYGFSQPYGVTVTPDGSKVYVSNGGNMTVGVINTSNNTLSKTIGSMGAQPRGIAANPAGTRVYVANSGSNNVSVIDTSSDSVVGLAITVGFTPISLGNFIGPAVSLSEAQLAFGWQQVGTTSSAQTVTLSNDGSSTINIGSISIGTDFTQTNTCGATLAAGASCEFSVTFTPSTTVTRNGTLSISTDALNSPHIVYLSGTSITSAGGGGGGGCSIGSVAQPDILLWILTVFSSGRLLAKMRRQDK